MVDRIRRVAGYDLYFYNSTMEHGIPSVWAIAKNKKIQGSKPYLCSMVQTPDPIRAVKSTIFELAGMMFRDDEKLETKQTEV